MKYFKISEFFCSCCGKEKMKQEFLVFIEELRDRCNFPFKITSGYRCKKKQNELTKKGYHTIKNSEHLQGTAVDISITDSQKRAKFLYYAMELTYELNLPFRVGIAGKSKGNFCHIDISKKKKSPKVWVY